MSFFGRSNPGPPPAQAMSERLEAAGVELDMVSDTFNRIVRTCFTKCVPNKFIEGSLNKGEAVCIDRCVAKYFLANEVVGKRMQATNEANAQQAAAASSSSSGGGIGSFFGM